jgi:site-specific DNA-methyltransferase (adenine-specific)
MKPYYQNELTTIYNGDCLEVMDYLIEQGIKVDCVITSPPYDDLRDYKGYSFDYKKTANKLYNIIQDDGIIVWVVGDKTNDGSESGTSFKQALYFKEIGFKLYDTMIYEKNALPQNNNRYEQAFEYMFIFTKTKPKTFNAILEKTKHFGTNPSGKFRQKNGETLEQNSKKPVKEFKTKSNIWKFKTGFNKTTKDNFAFEHPAMFPEQLVLDHITSWTNKNDLILDIFNGSGTTTKIAQQLNRRSIGIELEQKYCDIGIKRLNNLQIKLDI